MCRFIESIKLNNGVFSRLAYHQERINNVFADFFATAPAIEIATVLAASDFPTDGLYKCRLVFDNQIRLLEFVPYIRRDIQTLKLVETDAESTNYKSEDRQKLNDAFSKRGNCDDVLMIKNGLLTDTSYCNIALFDGENWVTPRLPIICGTNRAQLIKDKKMTTKDISQSEMSDFTKICLFNSMIEFGELILDVSAIKI